MEPAAALALVSDLSRALRHAASFEDAAAALLSRALDVADRAAAEHEVARGRVLRGMVHLRPGGGYRGLVVLERGAARPAAEDPRLLPSATIFGWLHARALPVAADVRLGVVEAIGGDRAPDRGRTAIGSQESRARLLGRDTTHILALPFGARAGEVDGMMSIEAACRGALDHLFVWPRCLALLTLLTDVAAPHLSTLPLRPIEAPDVDDLLPVVGRATAGLVRLLRVFAQQEETILIGGPTGSGKSRLARFCHERSPRRGAPFVVVDLPSVPEPTQMGELFGWKRGAFTGAVGDHRGHVGRAEGGTIFLDEIDKLSLQAQAGLLHLLEDRRYHALGEDTERTADVRFIAGTNGDLAALVREGRFREDLYYRINVLPVRLPPLAERADEIPRWADHMLARRAGSAAARLTAEAALLLGARPWPGNLRQLDNVIRRAYAIALAEGGGLTVQERHVADALALEDGARPRGLYEVLHRAAAAFVDEIAAGRPLDLDQAEAFRGLVIEAAVRRFGSKDEALQRLGKGALLKNRNHHKAIRREIAKVIDLAAALGVTADPETVALAQGAGD